MNPTIDDEVFTIAQNSKKDANMILESLAIRGSDPDRPQCVQSHKFIEESGGLKVRVSFRDCLPMKDDTD